MIVGRLPFIVAVCFLTGASSGAITHIELSRASGGSCVTGGAAGVNLNDLNGKFTRIGANVSQTPPLRLAANEQFTSDFQGLRVVGFLSSVAFEPKYRRAADAISESLHYPIRDIPLLPLSGQIVFDHPGLLELYQSNWAFRTNEAAHSWTTILVRAAASNGGTLLKGVVDGADETLLAVSKPQAGSQENAVEVAARLGPSVIQLSLRGGTALQPTEALWLANRAAARLIQACGTPAEKGGLL